MSSMLPTHVHVPHVGFIRVSGVCLGANHPFSMECARVAMLLRGVMDDSRRVAVDDN